MMLFWCWRLMRLNDQAERTGPPSTASSQIGRRTPLARPSFLVGFALAESAVGAEAGRMTGATGDDPRGDLVGKLRVIVQVLLGVFPPLAQPEVAVVEPRPGL